MDMRRFYLVIAFSGMVFQIGFLPLLPVSAQDAPTKNAQDTPKKQPPPNVATPGGEKTLAPISKRISTGFIDPGQIYVLPLLKREDVQAQIFLSPRQREALDALEKKQQEDRQQQLSQTQLPSPEELAGKSLEELRAFFAERAAKRSADLRNLNTNSDKAAAAILTPPQWKRLKELDLQWRGPLAMGVKEVAEQAKLTPSQMPAITDLLKQFQQEAGKRMKAVFTFTASGSQAEGDTEPGDDNTPSPSLAERQARIAKAAQEVEKTRKLLGEKALNTVTPEQKAQWSVLTGKPFIFRNLAAKD